MSTLFWYCEQCGYPACFTRTSPRFFTPAFTTLDIRFDDQTRVVINWLPKMLQLYRDAVVNAGTPVDWSLLRMLLQEEGPLAIPESTIKERDLSYHTSGEPVAFFLLNLDLREEGKCGISASYHARPTLWTSGHKFRYTQGRGNDSTRRDVKRHGKNWLRFDEQLAILLLCSMRR